MEEKIWIESEGLKLEATLVYSDDTLKPSGRILICSPHPFLGGDMRNNVLRHLVPSLSELGYVVLTFNYRGIGESETDTDLEVHQKQFWENSACPEYEDKIFIDSDAAFSFLKKTVNDDSPLIVIGYSFGCMPALRLLAQDQAISKGCFISPPLAKWTIGEEASYGNADKLFLYSPNDFACPQPDMIRSFESFKEPKTLRCIDEAGHFFVGYEGKLTAEICQFLRPLGCQDDE